MAKSKKPFSCPNFGAELWRTKNMNVFGPPRFGDDHWKMESKKVLSSSNVFQNRLLFFLGTIPFQLWSSNVKLLKKLVQSQKSLFWPPMFNIELWRPRKTFLVLCPFLPLNAQNFIFYAMDILYQFVFVFESISLQFFFS